MTARDVTAGMMIHLQGRPRIVRAVQPAPRRSVRLILADGRITLPLEAQVEAEG